MVKSIFFLTPGEEKFVLHYSETIPDKYYVQSIKKYIAAHFQIDASQISLLFNGKILGDTMQLKKVGLKDKSQVMVIFHEIYTFKTNEQTPIKTYSIDIEMLEDLQKPNRDEEMYENMWKYDRNVEI